MTKFIDFIWVYADLIHLGFLDPISRFLNGAYAFSEDAVFLIKNWKLYGFIQTDRW